MNPQEGALHSTPHKVLFSLLSTMTVYMFIYIYLLTEETKSATYSPGNVVITSCAGVQVLRDSVWKVRVSNSQEKRTTVSKHKNKILGVMLTKTKKKTG